MSLCERCHEREAVVHMTETDADESRTQHLCSRCAAGAGGTIEDAGLGTPLGAFLAAMGSGGAMLAAAEAQTAHCPACDATLSDFRASGRLGCPACWQTFERPLRELLRRIHGAARHVGAAPPHAVGVEGGSSVSLQRGTLQVALTAAVASERFEEAAELRDRLRALDGGSE